jgi:hypothetical protein
LFGFPGRLGLRLPEYSFQPDSGVTLPARLKLLGNQPLVGNLFMMNMQVIGNSVIGYGLDPWALFLRCFTFCHRNAATIPSLTKMYYIPNIHSPGMVFVQLLRIVLVAICCIMFVIIQTDLIAVNVGQVSVILLLCISRLLLD